MKVGILTFHWATNYGAVLQCYALQQTLTRLGMDVEVINYKPRRYDDSLYRFFKQHKYKNLTEYSTLRKKERAIGVFRRKNLNLTRRVHTCAEIGKLAKRYDLIVSGSDQVMNPSFLMWGESSKRRSPSYFLGFPYEGRRVAYAVSFGCVEYPQEARELATHYMGAFDAIGVRENTGVAIVESMGRSDAVVVPDPTILLPSEYYDSLATEGGRRGGRGVESGDYAYCFFLRNEEERRAQLGAVMSDKGLPFEELMWNNDDGDYSIQGWLRKIRNAKCVLTDSFHCMVMCLKLHKPFVVVTDVEGNEGMNDRFYSLLGRLGLSERVVYKGALANQTIALDKSASKNSFLTLNKDNEEKNGVAVIERVLNAPIDWSSIENHLQTYATVGEEFVGQFETK